MIEWPDRNFAFQFFFFFFSLQIFESIGFKFESVSSFLRLWRKVPDAL